MDLTAAPRPGQEAGEDESMIKPKEKQVRAGGFQDQVKGGEKCGGGVTVPEPDAAQGLGA